jgi:hypothetical protein
MGTKLTCPIGRHLTLLLGLLAQALAQSEAKRLCYYYTIFEKN